MKKLGMVVGAAAGVALVASAIVYKNYDEWFTFPPLRKIVSAQLKDPASAQFREERISRLGWLCGELNTKNGMGGYVGFKRYMVAVSGEAYLQDHGYVGEARQRSTQDIIDAVGEEIAVLKVINEQTKQGLLPSAPTKSEIEERVQKAVFDKKWGQVCDVT